ncbi:DUF2069 domain-containing protein [Alysiella filiformis]|uniref:Uncharacterized membrane protein n=1 Tax=Alysiella filiformis DSM 16848 TaxID=1120981 RepID=A0A286E1T4_9NEIS|nr:DUF2069 domain-containing protein [Alysiella filiformis]QMT30795.1 DUF2069 domain-containing protein [Alysiella filiformis]UBQ56224.1 DUF2069 domain-containing protein [Alysiella filiformis DSM 16848]SOD64855.1 Uncharacterized membrane protein [Alysiella filiformis DSM 16848]
MSAHNFKNKWFYFALFAWGGLILLTLVWDGLLFPLYYMMLIKLILLALPLRGIVAGRVYTFQYCSMLILAFFTEGVMRVVGQNVWGQTLAATEIALSVAFFVSCLAYLKQFKIKKVKTK